MDLKLEIPLHCQEQRGELTKNLVISRVSDDESLACVKFNGFTAKVDKNTLKKQINILLD